METPTSRNPFLVMNPRSGGGKVARFALVEKARRLGVTVVLLDHEGIDLAQLVRKAVDDGADLLGAAGGDGTLAVVAAVAAERDVAFVVIPAGTRNHFAMDLGLDRLHPDRALDALIDGQERRVDLGQVGDRTFVNTVSFGAYAQIVERPDYREDKLRVTAETLREVLAGHERSPFTVRAGDVVVSDPVAALVSNNPYRTDDPVGLGRRSRLDSGRLGVVCVRIDPPGRVPPPVAIRHVRANPPVSITTASDVSVSAPGRTIQAAIDGESVALGLPVECQARPGVLRVVLPPHARRQSPPSRRGT